MAIKFEKIQPGMTLYDRHRYKAGNVRGMTKAGEWAVKILSVDEEKQTAIVRWNGNLAETWYRRDLVKLFAAPKS